jgi:hypothetical protein
MLLILLLLTRIHVKISLQCLLNKSVIDLSQHSLLLSPYHPLLQELLILLIHRHVKDVEATIVDANLWL